MQMSFNSFTQDVFGESMMNYTIVVPTRADADFDAKTFLGGIKGNRPDRWPSQSYTFRSEYKTNGIRDVVIRMIDVVQTQQQGKPFSHLYFNKAEQKLKECRDEEEKARAQFEKEECKRWQTLLERAEKKFGKLLNKYCKDIQVNALDDIRQRDSLIQAIVNDLTSFKTALSKVIEVLHQCNDIKWPFNSTLKECVKSRLPKALNEGMAIAFVMIQEPSGIPETDLATINMNNRQIEHIEKISASVKLYIGDSWGKPETQNLGVGLVI